MPTHARCFAGATATVEFVDRWDPRRKTFNEPPLLNDPEYHRDKEAWLANWDDAAQTLARVVETGRFDSVTDHDGKQHVVYNIADTYPAYVFSYRCGGTFDDYELA